MTTRPDTPGRHHVGLIADTHGRLDERVERAFAGVDRILHAGDVGRPQVLWELETIAPVAAVLGNVDRDDTLIDDLPGLVQLEMSGVRITLVHDRSHLTSAHIAESDVIVFGHSHMPKAEEIDDVLWVNPGSASQPRRSPIGRSVGLLDIADGRLAARIVPLSEYGERP